MIYVNITQDDIDEANRLRIIRRNLYPNPNPTITPLKVRTDKELIPNIKMCSCSPVRKEINRWLLNGEFKPGKYGIKILETVNGKLAYK